jgi:RNA polymerase sigma-70 factor (ECF subfamily)
MVEEDLTRIRHTLTVSVRRVCPSWLADSADDIAQEAMLRVLGSLEKTEHSQGPSASYLWKVAYTATVDEIRRVRRRQERPLEAAELERRGPVDAAGPLREAREGELVQAVTDCLRRLRESRRLMVGFHLMGHSLAESQDLSGWDAKKVRNLLYRGLADLRRCLAARGF